MKLRLLATSLIGVALMAACGGGDDDDEPRRRHRQPGHLLGSRPQGVAA